LKRSTKIQAGILAGVLLAGGAGIVAIALNQPGVAQSAPATSTVVADNSHRLDVAENSNVTFTEFLDFECEVCGAVYPVVEELREEYAGRVTFVARYFPLPGHFNSRTAAIAVEAAAQQGKFEEMYHRMFETQGEWGEQQVSAADRFREFAQELDLDLDAYDDTVADPATEARVQQDYDAATALGATGTPTIFVNDEYIPLTSPDDLRTALDVALSEQ
jgi:protein-disulfide isomerase